MSKGGHKRKPSLPFLLFATSSVGIFIVAICCVTGCTWIFSNMTDQSATELPRSTTVITPNTTSDITEDTRNPAYLFFERYAAAKHTATEGLFDSVYSADTGNGSIVELYFSFLAHDNELLSINSCIGMLYSYDNGWGGTLTGAYAGSGRIRFKQGAYLLSFVFNTGESISGSLEGDLLKCDMLDTAGNLICQMKIECSGDRWLSQIIYGDECSLMQIDVDSGLAFTQGSADSLGGYNIDFGLESIADIPLTILVYDNGVVSVQNNIAP